MHAGLRRRGVGTAHHWVIDVIRGWLVVLVSWALATSDCAGSLTQPSMSQPLDPARLNAVPAPYSKDAPCNRA